METIEFAACVRAYPNPSEKYGETVCVAGIRTDIDPQWVRLYPVQYRDLPDEQQFKKWDVVRVQVRPHSQDKRPESMRPIEGTFEIVERLDPSKRAGRIRRAELIDGVRAESMCGVQRRQAVDGTSLAVFRPANVYEFTMDPEPAEWDPKRDSYLEAAARAASQQSLWGPSLRDKTKLEKVPFRFKYHYKCSDPGCPGKHSQSIIDWELFQSWRNFRWKYGEEEALTKLHDKWMKQMCSDPFDTHFFTGNLKAHPNVFVMLGVYWPKKAAA